MQKQQNDWSTGLVDPFICYHHPLICFDWTKAVVCPCMDMYTIADALAFRSANDPPSASDEMGCTTCLVSSAISMTLDMPPIFCMDIGRQRLMLWCCPQNSIPTEDTQPHQQKRSGIFDYIFRMKHQEQYENDNNEEDESQERNDDEWDPHKSSYDWWPLSWCWFYSCASFESCCSSLCCGPTVKTANFPLAYGLCLACIYPISICPLACLLRQGVKKKLNIQTENSFSTCFKTIFCLPCSLVQTRMAILNQAPSTMSHTPPSWLTNRFFHQNHDNVVLLAPSHIPLQQQPLPVIMEESQPPRRTSARIQQQQQQTAKTASLYPFYHHKPFHQQQSAPLSFVTTMH